MRTPAHPVLVVDDDAVNRDLLSRRLQRRGYPVQLAASGEEALQFLSINVASIVLLDIEMPVMGGLEVLQTIRRTWPASRLPIIMVTARDRSDDIVTALDLGADDYITKPIDFAVTMARIRTQLARRDAEDRLRTSEERYALAAQGANDGLWDWDLSTGHIYFSDRWKAIIGYADADFGEGPDAWFSLVHSEDLPQLQRDLDAHLAGRTPHFESEYRLRHRDGAFRWVLARGLAVRDANGRPVRMAGSQSDITAGKVVDPLTGLPNRVLLIDRIERVIEHHHRRGGAQFAVLFLDLDGFKLVNDSVGHLHGDELLQAVARRLERSLRQTDILSRPSGAPDDEAPRDEATIARLGGDEFVVLLHEVEGVLDAIRVADRIHRALTPAFTINGREIFTSASIGIAVSATGYDRSADVLRDADTAMYRAKSLGKGRTEVFDTVMREKVVARLHLDTALRLAVERQEFVAHYQPIISLQTGELVGFEALIRWQHPTRGLVLPEEFITVAEDNGLVMAIGRRFFADVCRQIRAWEQEHAHIPKLSVNVNFAGQQFIESGLVDYLIETLDDSELSPDQLVVEITESTAIGNFPYAIEVLNQIRDAGLRIVLDDFGTGFSSLSCLHELPIVGVKLDRSFIRSDHRHPEVLRAIVMLADQLGLTTTAEGIETEEQWQQLRDMGCTYAQGFLISHPLDAESAGHAVREQRIWTPETASIGWPKP